ncbi:DUF262 domain-containing protein [Bacillus sp. RAR_GA_16]|uniref:DUF262 domain-containing protein n=1 Tax=Bacillus sp. RAR_GA_16 TaxID=2876774 RepID=UPI001CCEC7B7|nr:DUF262 domain-containing protein [Bacillus sp. RAR_GA_16]MCA0172973.1 DUF262 domain-containing protein [Bacillus sp. RAR_GA_16]
MEIEDYFEPKAVNVRNFFRQDNKKYYIPDHQRNYAWTDNELEDLWSDFISVVKNSLDESNGYTEKHNARPYFLGGIVLTKKERNYEIIDGQQRLTTITILAKSLADLARRIDDPHSFTGIINSLKDIYTYSDPLDDFEPFLHLDDSINNFFLNYILTRHTPQERAEYYNRNTPRRKAAELIKGAHDFFLTKLEIEFPQDIDQGVLINKLKGYVKILTRYMSFLKIIVQDRAMAYVIFGSLNKRGKDLSGSDLIKNELFKRETNDRRYSELKNSWDGVINTIENENLTGYIRFQYASKYGNVKPRDLFSTITEHITKTTTPSSYVTELEEESEWFARINSIGTQYWNNSITAKLKTFKKIDITHHTPLLLTGAVKYGDSQADFERLLDSLITFCIRYFTIGSQTVNDSRKRDRQHV